MKKYAKIINEQKQCEVGIGTNSEFYQSIGMAEMDVEQAYNGFWYVKGYAPEKPQIEINAERIVELKQKLSETDYVVIKIAEGEATAEEYSEVLANRKAWRAEINELES